MNKPLKEWTFTDLEYFLSEHDLSIREVMSLLGSGMGEMILRARQDHFSEMEKKYMKTVNVIMTLIVTDLTEEFLH